MATKWRRLLSSKIARYGKNALFQSGQNMGDMMMFKVSKLTIGTQTDIGYSVSMTYSSLLDRNDLGK